MKTIYIIRFGLVATTLTVFLLFLRLLKNPLLNLDTNGGHTSTSALSLARRKSTSRHASSVPPPVSSKDPSPEQHNGPGEMGEPVIMDKDQLNSEQAKIYEHLLKLNGFNQYASDLISVRRQLPDMRPLECRNDAKHYLSNLPDSSIIVCFYNEAWSTLLRTVHSAIDRSPSHLVKEVILVDDASTLDHLQKPLEDYIAQYPKIKLVRSNRRLGLIKARIFGFRHSTGTVAVFLDSHVECTTGWLEPLLDRIARNSSTVVWPVIEVIDLNTFEYKDLGPDRFGMTVGGFDWGLMFTMHHIPERDNKTRAHDNAPVRSATMPGGLFAIERNFFERIGLYDPEMDIWGGENLELSFKTWMCGGRLEMIPCSRVGHLYRETSDHYNWTKTGSDFVKKNLVRLATVWLDDYKKYYFSAIDHNLGDYGDVSDRIALRKKLNCHSFTWYLDNVLPEMFVPERAQAYGQIQNAANDGGYCIDGVDQAKLNQQVKAAPCHGQEGNQYFSWTYTNEIRRNRCFDYPDDDGRVFLNPCHNQKGNQYWEHDRNTGSIFSRVSETCLELKVEELIIVAVACNSSRLEQQWIFSTYKNDTLTDKAVEMVPGLPAL